MYKRMLLVSVLATLSVGTGVSSAVAGDGPNDYAVGARHKALAGAGVADLRDSTAAFLNPAGLVGVGDQFTASISIREDSNGFSSSGAGGFVAPGSHESELDSHYLPNISVSKQVDWWFLDAIGVSLGQLATTQGNFQDFPNPSCPPTFSGAFCGGALGVDLTQEYLSLALASDLGNGLSVGFGPMFVRQTVSARGLSLFSGFSNDPASFSDLGDDTGYGVGLRGGLLWKLSPGIRLGISGNTEIEMENHAKYRGLFAGNGNLDVPATLQAGVAFDPHQDLTLMFDYRRIWYGSIPALNNANANPGLFGTPNSAGFGWQDLDIFKVGAEWRYSDRLSLRAGYSYNTGLVRNGDADLNILLPTLSRHHLTAGLKYSVAENSDVEISGMYSPEESISGPELGNPFRQVEVRSDQFEVSIGFVHRFGGEPQIQTWK